MLLNKEKVDELFRKEAVLIGKFDVIPEFRAVHLFGKDAVDFAHKVAKGCGNGFGIGEYTVMYISYHGFQLAASYYNVQQLKEEAIT